MLWGVGCVTVTPTKRRVCRVSRAVGLVDEPARMTLNPRSWSIWEAVSEMRVRAGIWLAIAGLTAAAFVGSASAGEARDCKVDSQPRNTEDNVLHVCNQAQLDHLFATLHAGSMPAYGARSTGYWRLYPDGHNADYTVDNVFDSAIWHGKVFYTHRNGGRSLDMVAGGQLAFPAKVGYGRAQVDGHRAIVVDYLGAGDPLGLVERDEIRQLQPGLYMGFAWYGVSPSSTTGLARATFVLDFIKH